MAAEEEFVKVAAKAGSTTEFRVKGIGTSPMLLALSLSACASSAVQVEAPGKAASAETRLHVIDSASGSVRDIRVGMSESELLLLGYPLSRAAVLLEGDSYPVIDIEIGPQAVVRCLLDDLGRVHQFSATSRLIRDERGSGVGTTLRELERKYSDGKLLIGDEDGKFATFVRDEHVLFRFDKSEINESCGADSGTPCEMSSNARVSEIVVVGGTD